MELSCQLMPWPLYARGRKPQYPFIRRLDWPPESIGMFWGRDKSLSLVGIENPPSSREQHSCYIDYTIPAYCPNQTLLFPSVKAVLTLRSQFSVSKVFGLHNACVFVPATCKLVTQVKCTAWPTSLYFIQNNVFILYL